MRLHAYFRAKRCNLFSVRVLGELQLQLRRYLCKFAFFTLIDEYICTNAMLPANLVRQIFPSSRNNLLTSKEAYMKFLRAGLCAWLNRHGACLAELMFVQLQDVSSSNLLNIRAQRKLRPGQALGVSIWERLSTGGLGPEIRRGMRSCVIDSPAPFICSWVLLLLTVPKALTRTS